jgi:hypothetical protein
MFSFEIHLGSCKKRVVSETEFAKNKTKNFGIKKSVPFKLFFSDAILYYKLSFV